MKEYLIKYKIGTDWHEPHNTTTYNYYTEIYNGDNAREATRKVFGDYSNILGSPNKSLEIISIKLIG